MSCDTRTSFRGKLFTSLFETGSRGGLISMCDRFFSGARTGACTCCATLSDRESRDFHHSEDRIAPPFARYVAWPAHSRRINLCSRCLLLFPFSSYRIFTAAVASSLPCGTIFEHGRNFHPLVYLDDVGECTLYLFRMYFLRRR